MVSTKEMPNKHTRTISLDYRPLYPVHSRVSKHHSKWSLLFMSSSTTYDLSSLLNRPIVHSANPVSFYSTKFHCWHWQLWTQDRGYGVWSWSVFCIYLTTRTVCFYPSHPQGQSVCLYLSHHEDSLSEARAEPGCHVQPPLLPHAPVVGGLGKAEVTVGHVGTHRPLAGANRPLCPLGESAGRALPRVGPPPPQDPVDWGG